MSLSNAWALPAELPLNPADRHSLRAAEQLGTLTVSIATTHDRNMIHRCAKPAKSKKCPARGTLDLRAR
jgi:hypothetical protein